LALLHVSAEILQCKRLTQGLPNMMLELRAVLEWYPEADAYDLLGSPQRGR
jgi:hypothetical protein